MKARVGDVFYSEYFLNWCQILEILPDKYFIFKTNGKTLKSHIKTTYLEEGNYIFRRVTKK